MPMMALIFLVTTLTAGYIHVASIVQSKRMRLFLCLPVPSKSVGEMRFLYPLFMWMSLLVMFWMMHTLFTLFTPKLYVPSGANLLYINGLILITYSLYLIYVDALHIYRNRVLAFAGGFLWFFVFIAALMPFYIIVNFAGAFGTNTPLQCELQNIMNDVSVGVSLNVVGYVIYRVSYYLFPARKTFFD